MPRTLSWRAALPDTRSGFVLAALELVLLALAALLAARLVATVLSPPPRVVPSVTAARQAPPAELELLTAFDPFSRLAAASGPTVITSLDLQLFGIRLDQASGRGSAIIAAPDGQQRSFVVGEEIVPGAKLAGVAADHVTIDRNGAVEQLYMGQSAAPAPSGP